MNPLDNEKKINSTTTKMLQGINDITNSYNELMAEYRNLAATKNAELIEVKAKSERRLEVLKELLDSTEYWNEYDVPLGIVDRIKEAVEE